MTVEHIDEVLEIENLSFPTPWTKLALVQEVTENLLANYRVVLLKNRVIAYGGMWLIIDEAHITNIAVHPEFRRKGVGEILLQCLIKEAEKKGIYNLTLEVRPSNLGAIRLYEKYDFEVLGRRKGYYQDTKEDAFIMWRNKNKDLQV